MTSLGILWLLCDKFGIRHRHVLGVSQFSFSSLLGIGTANAQTVSSQPRAKDIFTFIGGTQADRDAYALAIDQLLATPTGNSLYLAWKEKSKFHPIDKILNALGGRGPSPMIVDVDCTGCREANAVGMVKSDRHSSNGTQFRRFDVFVPASLLARHVYFDGSGTARPITMHHLIAHEVFGHGFAGWGRGPQHRDVVQIANRIMSEFDPSFVPETLRQEYWYHK